MIFEGMLVIVYIDLIIKTMIKKRAFTELCSYILNFTYFSIISILVSCIAESTIIFCPCMDIRTQLY